VKRSLIILGLAALPIVGPVSTAEATGGAACTITGTISFEPSPVTPADGKWRIEPAVIDCRGLFRSWERILGPGVFAGSGTYTTLPTSGASCLHNIGSGIVDYRIPTTEADVHLNEQHNFVLAGAGAFSTPTLRGTFQVTPPYEGDCVTKRVTKALFLAEASMVRHRSPELTAPSGHM
jgi:hypothetical protein